MSYKLTIRRAAQREFHKAIDWYEEEQHGLGEAFLNEVLEVLGSVTANPLRYAIVHVDFRMALVHRFPYAVYFDLSKIKLLYYPLFILLAIRRFGSDVSREQFF